MCTGYSVEANSKGVRVKHRLVCALWPLYFHMCAPDGLLFSPRPPLLLHASTPYPTLDEGLVVRKDASVRLIPAIVEVFVGVNNRSSTMIFVTCKKLNLLSFIYTAHLLVSMRI